MRRHLQSLMTIPYLLFLAAAPAGPRALFEPGPCPFAVPAQYTVNCGTLSVPADHAQPQGPTLQLAVAIVKSTSAQPAPDPVVYLNGGPGGHTFTHFDQTLLAFEPFLATRDVIFYDQRGVGLSRPALECPEFMVLGAEAAGQTPDPNMAQALLVQAAQACHTRLEAAGIDLKLFTSAQSVRDLALLRQALGYPAWNLYGISYGTRLGLTAIRDDPASVRALVVDAVYPPAVSLGEGAPNAQRGINQLFAGCAADWVCHAAYPDLPTVFYATAERLRDAPVPYAGRDPQTKTARTLLVTEYVFVNAVFNALYSSAGVELLPALIYDVHEGHYAQLANLTWGFEQRVAGGISMGMSISVQCSEEFAFTDRAAIQAAYASVTPAVQNFARERLLLSAYFLDVCAAWDVAAPNPVENAPVTSTVPTLIFSGEYDPVTPPAWGALAGATLPNSYVYEFPALGHGVLAGGACPAAMALAFFQTPTQAPATACIARMPQKPAFRVRAAVSVWPTWALAAVLGAVLLVSAARAVGQRPRGWLGWRLLRVIGWGPAAATLGFFVVAWVLPIPANVAFLQRENLVMGLCPLLAGLHATLLFSPEDEPALELALTLPRPLTWVVGERWVWLMALHGGLALALTGFTALALQLDFWTLCARWVVPMLVLVALALRLTLSTRQAVLSLGLTLLLWFGLLFMGDWVVGQWPFLWPLHLYLAPTHAHFWLNRLVLLALGLALWPLAIAPLLANTEQLLFGQGKAATNLTAYSPFPVSAAAEGGRGGRSEKTQLSSEEAGRPPSPSLPPARGKGVPLYGAFQVIRQGAVFAPAIALAEVKLHWRRKALLILCLATAAMPVIGAFIVRQDMAGTITQMTEAGGVAPAEIARQVTTNATLITWAALFVVLLLILPPVVADTFPRDAQWGMAELLGSLPVPRGVFILGKLLGLWASLLLGLAGLGAGVVLVWGLLVYPLDLALFLPMFVWGGVGLALVQSGLSALAALPAPNRRWALAIGLGIAFLSLIGLALGLRQDPLLQTLNPGRPALFLFFLFGNAPPANLPVVTLNAVYLTLLVGAVEVVLLTLIMKRAEGRVKS